MIIIIIIIIINIGTDDDDDDGGKTVAAEPEINKTEVDTKTSPSLSISGWYFQLQKDRGIIVSSGIFDTLAAPF